VTQTAFHPAILDHPAATPGWFHHGPTILELVERHKPKVCVELGTWLGASAIPVARSVARWGGTLTCVDTWAGDLSGAPDIPPAPWMLVACARNILSAGVGANVRLIPARTLEAAAAWTEPIDYLYIDAAHDYDSVRVDLHAWVPKVKPGGLILGDDYGNRVFAGVRQAWDEFEQTTCREFTRYQSTPPHPDGVQLIYGTV
jgi:predicted O-methyltransferase YrrM